MGLPNEARSAPGVRSGSPAWGLALPAGMTGTLSSGLVIIASIVLPGSQVLAYAALWILMPRDPESTT